MDMSEPASFPTSGLRGDLRYAEPMAPHLSWRAGGSADRCYVPADLADLAHFVKAVGPAEPLHFVGLGSNLLVRDGGLRGTVVLLHGALNRIELAGPGLIYAEAGVGSPKVASFAAQNDLEGAEFLAGIPGTVGGALFMNAGCHGQETWQCVERVLTLARDGELRERHPSEYDVRYRHAGLRAELGEEWFAAAWLRFAPGSGAQARLRSKELLARRMASQPLTQPNAGSVFRNPPGDYAARLIEACGLKGRTVGGAQVSQKHANFIVNLGDALASDIERLIETVQATVKADHGIELVREVEIVGEEGQRER